ncbi:MAG: DUF861 domain-containing protein [Proteobacteria bacterium]|nr:DUF861 domain-containing protein [Pseudomonadota bacterium]
MKLITNFAFLCLAFLALAAHADSPAALPKPVKVTAAEARGAVFKGKDAVQDNSADGPATDVPKLKSRDGKFVAGLYSAGPSDVPIESYSEDEFMFFLEGGVTLTSADGTVLHVKAGEGAFMPKGWKGRWTTKGYKKYYVTYSSHD